MSDQATLRRVVLGLHQGLSESLAIAAATEIAALLHLDLVGVYFEDPDLIGAAGLPFTREFRLAGLQWAPLDPGGVESELRRGMQRVQRLLDERARALGLAPVFETRRGHPATDIATLVGAGDVLVLTEPHGPGTYLLHPFAPLLQSALGCAAATLLVPARGGRNRGTITVAVAGADDPTLPLAARVAQSMREELLVLCPAETTGASATAIGARLESDRQLRFRVRSLPTVSLQGIEWTLPDHERLLVLGRALVPPGEHKALLALAGRRRVSVLVL